VTLRNDVTGMSWRHQKLQLGCSSWGCMTAAV